MVFIVIFVHRQYTGLLLADKPSILRTVPGAIPNNLYEPLQHRLAFHGTNGMTVSWSSFKQIDTPTVYYGTDPRNLSQIATSNESTTYETSRTYNNHVTLSGLQPGTKYWYQGGLFRVMCTFITPS